MLGYQVFTVYFKELEEESIRLLSTSFWVRFAQNYTHWIPYDIRCYVGTSHRSLINLNCNPRLSPAGTNAVSWHSKCVKHRKNEVFLDVIESVTLLVSGDEFIYEYPRMVVLQLEIDIQVNANSNVLRSKILGAIKMKCLLSSMPDVRFRLNNKILF